MRRSNAIWALLALLAVAHVAAAARAAGRRQRVKAASDAPAAAGNPKPLIGILTQPCHYCPGKSYIGSAYVKMVEMAGGRAVPVRFYASDEELYRIFKSINGLIFPGGLTWLWLDSPYVLAARKLWNWAREENDKGNPFPIHGTCLGHQLLHILPSNVSRNYLLVDTDSVAHPANLEWTAEAESTRFYSTMPEDLKAKLADPKLNIALENHMYGIPPSHYERWPDLKEEFTIVSTTKDRNGTEYISTVEGKKYPFTGTQWHPEKPPFEFGMEEVPHSLDAIRVSQQIANNFIEVARKSQHFPISNEEGLALQIYSTPLTFSARFEVFDEEQYDGPDSTYYFDEKDPEFPPGPDPEDAPDAEFTASSGTQQEARSEQQEAHGHAKGRVDNAPRHLRTHKGARFFNARQMEAFFT